MQSGMNVASACATVIARRPRGLAPAPLDRRGGRASYRGIFIELERGKLRARGDAELGIDVAEVVVDCALGEEHLGGDLFVRESVGDVPRDLQLSRCQLPDRARVALAGGFPGGA